MSTAALLVRGFDVRRHLGTKTRYAYRLAIPGAPSVYKAPDPDGYDPVHLYLVARHGTRWPTADRMRQINQLDTLFRDARNVADNPWLRNWTAPFSNVGLMGGELHPTGADELWGLAYRLRKRFPSLASLDYLPKRFPVVSTQVARTAASASAFTSGFFPDVGSEDPQDDSRHVNSAPPTTPPADSEEGAAGAGRSGAAAEAEAGLGAAAGRPRRALSSSSAGAAAAAGPLLADDLDETLRDSPAMRRPQAVAISMSPKEADPLLRFFEVCPAYAQHDEFTEKWISSWMQGNWSRLVPALQKRLGLVRDMSPCEVEGVWQLCLLEAGLYGATDRACSLFQPEEAMMLEWVDDIHLLETQSYGATINYDIAAPLLRDAVETLRAAASGTRTGEVAPAARLIFAHCETLVPLASLLGLFRPPLQPPPAASHAQLDAAVSRSAASRHLHQVDTVEDLQMVVRGLHHLNGRPQGPRSPAPGLTSEDSHVCYKGRPGAPDIPPPEGWYPWLPSDDSRLFKGARIAPFAANLALVLYGRRETGGPYSGRPSHLVRLLYNEQVLPIPGCSPSPEDPGAVDCPLDTFLELVQGKIDPHALDRLCGPGSNKISRGDGSASKMYDNMGGGSAAAAS